MSNEKEEKVIVNEEKKPCGCSVETYEDGSKFYEPCYPHALDNAGQQLRAAAAAYDKMVKQAIDHAHGAGRHEPPVPHIVRPDEVPQSELARAMSPARCPKIKIDATGTVRNPGEK